MKQIIRIVEKEAGLTFDFSDRIKFEELPNIKIPLKKFFPDKNQVVASEVIQLILDHLMECMSPHYLLKEGEALRGKELSFGDDDEEYRPGVVDDHLYFFTLNKFGVKLNLCFIRTGN